MTKRWNIGDWIVHEDGGLTHVSCGCSLREHRNDGYHVCLYPSRIGGENFVPIIVCELMKLNRSLYWGRDNGD